VNKIAFTFDLCEQPYEVAGYDGAVVDVLREYAVRATFFGGGKWITTHPQRARQLISPGRLSKQVGVITGRAPSALSSSVTVTNAKLRLCSAGISSRRALAVCHPRPLAWNRTMEPGRTLRATSSAILAALNPFIGSPEETSH
jgi:hypothetical protein